MSISRKTHSLMLGLGLAIGMSSAQAAMVNFTLTGDVDTLAEPGNVFGLNFFDTITATGSFDDSALTLGSGTISFHNGSGNSITLYVGNLTYTASDDYNFLLTGNPNLSLAGGVFTGLNFATDPYAPTSFNSLDSYFDGYEEEGFNQTLSGTWDSASFQMTAVPVPAAVWLLGSGLLGLVGVARRKTAVR